MEGETNIACNTAGVKTMDSGGLPRQDPQTPSVCPMCGAPGHDDSTQQLHTKKTLHFCSHCRECYMTVPNTKSNKGQMTGFYSAKIKMRNQAKEVGYQCLLCNQMFGTLSDRNAHMGKHMGVNTHMCTKCGFVSNYKSAIDAHMVTHTKEYSHKCPVCCKGFATSTNMDQHLKMHLGDSLHRCQQCSFVTPDVQAQIMTVSLVQSETEDHAGMLTQNINISITYSYPSEHEQPNLLLGSHEDKSSHLARPIKSDYYTGSGQNYHEQGKSHSVGGGSDEVDSMLSVSKQPGKAALQTLPLPGKVNIQVDKGVATQPGVARTIARGTAARTLDKAVIHSTSVLVPDHATIHVLDKPIKRILQSQESVDMLTSPRPHRCFVCGKTFAYIQKFQAHMKLHTDGIIYTCPECGKTFKRPFNLKMHMESHTSQALEDPKRDKIHEEDRNPEAHKNSEEDKSHGANINYETDKNEEADLDHETDEKHETHNHQQTDKNHKRDNIEGPLNSGTNHGEHLENHSKCMYMCPVCNVKFKQKGWLKEHMEIHSLCTLCKSFFSSPEELNKHILTHTMRNEVKCMICFNWFSDLPEHMETHPISNSTETNASEDKLMVHVSKESIQGKGENSDTGKAHKCSVCGMTFEKRVYLLIHKQLHEPQKSYVCSLCGDAKRNIRPFTAHMERHILDNQHQCSDCGKTFTRQDSLEYHIKVKHPDGDESVQCSVCHKVFAHTHSLKRHIRGSHSERKYACLYCDKHFAIRYSLNIHMRLHQDKGDYECSLCGKYLRSASSLKMHKMVHTGEKPFMCSLCGKQFRTKSTLKEHMLIHTGEKPHMCAICGKTYASSVRLRNHMQCHTRKTLEKNHECSECGKMTYSAAHLKIHMASHSDERPYSCNECGRSFKTKRSLQRHSHVPKRRGRKKKKTEYEELTETVAEQPGVSSNDQPFIPVYVGGNPEPYALTVEVVSDV